MSDQPRLLRLVIVDDHEVVRSGLRAVLGSEPDLEIVAEADNADAALTRIRIHRPDIVLMDVRMGDGADTSGIAACRDIRDELPDTRVIMFSSFGERDSVLAAIMAGAAGFLTKNVSRARLVEAIRAVGRGESILDPAVTRAVLDRITDSSGQAGDPAGALTEREKEVLRLIAQGYTNKEIAALLDVSPFTARNHVTHILDKLGVSRRSEAAAHAVRLGLFDDHGEDAG